MADRTLTVKIGANVAGFVSGMKTVAQATQDASKKAEGWVQTNKQGIGEVSNLLLGTGAALTGFALLAANTAANFDASMSSVQAATMETATNMGLLREAAIEAGASTSFSATEAAGAIEELAKAGVSTADILAGGLSGALNLAASDGMAVADAAAIASSAMVQFGLSGKDTAHVADLLASGAGKALGSVSDLGGALNQSGLVASQMGLSIEETTGSLAMFAESGLIGSDAGTSFRSMLLRLANPTKESKKLMDELGISAYDAGGNFVGMESLAGQLQSQLGGLTQEQRNSALATIFGQDAIRAAAIAYENGAEGVATWTTAVDDQGYAADQARIRLDNLKGDLEGLGGAWETALINLGSTADGPLRALVQGATDAVNAFSGLPEGVQGATMAIAGGGGLALLGVGALGKLVVGVSDAKDAFENLGLTAKTATGVVAGVGAAVAVATFAFTAWADSSARTKARIDGIAQSLDQVTGEITESTSTFVASDLYNGTGLMGWSDSVADSAAMLGLDLDVVTQAILGNADAMAVVEEASRAAGDRFSEVGDQTAWLSEKAKEAGTDMTGYGNAMKIVRDGVEAYQGNLETAADKTREIAKATGDATGETDGLAGATDESKSALLKYAEQTAASKDETDDYVTALSAMIDAQNKAAGVVMSLRDAERGFEQSIADAKKALEENGQTLDITTQKGRDNQAALDGVAKSGWDVITSMQKNGATQAELQAAMATSRQRFVEMAGPNGMGMSIEAANALADELGLIPEDVDVVANVHTSTAMGDLATLAREIRNLPDGNVKITTTRVDGSVRSSTATMATGGLVRGPGDGTSDDVPIWASNGEWVIRQRSAAKYGPAFMQAVNDGTYEPRAGKFANGGEVGGYGQYMSHYSSPTPAPQVNVSTPGIDYGRLAAAILTGAQRVSDATLSAQHRSDLGSRSTAGGVALMVVAISAALLPDAGAPQAGVTVTGAPASPTPVVVETSWDGGVTWVGIRGGKRVISGGDLFRDHVPALNIPVLYRVEVAGAWTVSAPVTIASESSWLQDPLNPRSAVAVSCVHGGVGLSLQSPSFGTQQRQQLADLAMVDGARLPVASLGMRRAPASVPLHLRAVVATQSAFVKALSDLMNSAGQVVIRSHHDHGLDPVAHVIAPDLQDSLVVGGLMGTYRDWQMTVDQVRPTSLRISVPWWTYDQVRALWPSQSYSAVKATRPGSTYIDWKADPTP